MKFGLFSSMLESLWFINELELILWLHFSRSDLVLLNWWDLLEMIKNQTDLLIRYWWLLSLIWLLLLHCITWLGNIIMSWFCYWLVFLISKINIHYHHQARTRYVVAIPKLYSSLLALMNGSSMVCESPISQILSSLESGVISENWHVVFICYSINRLHNGTLLDDQSDWYKFMILKVQVSIYIQVQRRLEQNREAARKSRMRKKVNMNHLHEFHC